MSNTMYVPPEFDDEPPTAPMTTADAVISVVIWTCSGALAIVSLAAAAGFIAALLGY